MKKINLDRTFVHHGQFYGPGSGVEVPDDFPSGLQARAVKSAPAATPPSGSAEGQSVGGQTGEDGKSGTPARPTKSEYEAQDKGALLALAEERKLTVTGTGENGAVLKRDLIAALTEADNGGAGDTEV